MAKPKVAIVKGKDPEELVEKSVCLLGGIEQIIHPGDHVVIKPNLTATWPGMHPGVITNSLIVRGAIKIALAAKAGEVIIGEGAGGADTEEAYEISGIKGIAREFGIKLIDFNQAESVEVSIPNGRVLKQLPIAKAILDSDVIINLPVLKTTHPPFNVTCGLKNFMGVLPGKGKYEGRYFTAEYVAHKGFWESTGGKDIVHRSGKLSQSVIDLNTAIKNTTLTIVDGITGLEAGGPLTGDPVRMDLVIAGTNRVAVDAVAATVMGFDPASLNFLRFATRAGLGPHDLNEIEVVGESISAVQRKFKPFPSPAQEIAAQP